MGTVRPHIRFCCISYGEVILVSHQTELENYTPTIRSILPSLPDEDLKKLTYPVDSFQVHILIDNGNVYSCITNRTNKHLLPFIFLENVRNKFCEIPSLLIRTPTATENEFDRDFAPVLASVVYDFNVGRGDKISVLQAQVDDVKQIMLDSVQKVIDRGDRLEDLLAKTEDLEASGGVFRQQARNLRTRAKCKNIKMWLLIGSFLGTILTIALLIATGVIPL